ncbi:hypothetical protein Tco_0035332, partial [Tanacetum coccineum]
SESAGCGPHILLKSLLPELYCFLDFPRVFSLKDLIATLGLGLVIGLIVDIGTALIGLVVSERGSSVIACLKLPLTVIGPSVIASVLVGTLLEGAKEY